MNILLCSHHFSPSLGGIELNSLMLADEFVALGHSVKVMTQTPSSETSSFSYNVVRQPSFQQLLRLVQWADIVFHNNICLQMAWPLLLVRRPWVISHHVWMTRVGGHPGWQDRLKRFSLRFASNITHSHAMAEHIGISATIIGIPYREELFHCIENGQRDQELVFLGRLVSDKGLDILVDALALLKTQGLIPHLTVIGDGEERQASQQYVRDRGLTAQICFVGIKTGNKVAKLLNSHQILVIPSRWQEPFAVVALEGAACGCVVIASDGGGMKDAVGPCGITFPNGNTVALAGILADLLTYPEKRQQFVSHAPAHLAKHKKRTVAEAHIAVFQSAGKQQHKAFAKSHR